MNDSPLPLIHDRGAPGRRGTVVPSASERTRRAAMGAIPDTMRRKWPAPLPEVSELDAVRHFTLLSQRNYSIDGQFYPLGSCTMKYNPKINDLVASMPGFLGLHPLQDDSDAQGTLRLMHELESILVKVLGLPGVTLCPAAGAQGEFAGMSIIKQYHRLRNTGRDTVIIPDSAHGTNPASAVLAGFKVREIKSNANGRVDVANLKAAIDDKTAAIMLTNPNTCGLFERDIREIAKLIHDAGGLLYYDGANLNAIVGRARPGDMGFDVVHMNLHKTFSTPHGGGGPGAGPVGVSERCLPYLPEPRVVRRDDGTYRLAGGGAESIGKIMAFHGNVGVLLRALSFAYMHGGKGLWDVATMSVLNANYILARLPAVFESPFDRPCKHEALVTVRKLAATKNIKAFDVAKRLLDLGYHAPTIYFPLLVPECLLIEPTETESKQTLDGFIAAMEQIAREIEADPDALRNAPSTTPTGRLDDAKAMKELNVCCRWGGE